MKQLRKPTLGVGSLAILMLVVGCEGMQPRTPINVASLGPQVGEQVPSFSLPDQHGEVQTLESVLGPKGAILLFHRSADW